MDHSNNAVMAKVRALYGKRLTANDYDQLLSKKSISEVTGYLKKETYYQENLLEVKEELIHRGQLESLVRRRILNTYRRIMHYSTKRSLALSMYAMKNEIDQILMAIRLLNAGAMNRYIVAMPVHMSKLMSFDLFAVARITSFDDLLAILEHTDYYRIVGRFRPATSAKFIDITSCEAALLTYYYQRSLDIARTRYSGQTQKDLVALLRFQVSMHNITVIYRMRRYLSANKAMITPRLLQMESSLRDQVYQRLLDAPDLPALHRELSDLKSIKRIDFDWSQSSQLIVRNLDQVSQVRNQKLFRFSTQPAVTVITYMALLEIEVRNIIHIIEGIRYGVPPAEIRQLLTL